LLNILKDEAIDIKGIHIAPDVNSVLVLDLIDAQKHEHVFIGSPSVGEPAPYTADMQSIIASAQALFLQGYTLHEQRLISLVPAVIADARQRGIPIYFDVGPTVRHLPYDRVREMIAQTNILLMTEDEVALATNGLIGDTAYRDLLGTGVHTLVVKQGANGCTIVRADSNQHVPGFTVPVVDTVGAGDCFDAAFIYGQLQGWDDRTTASLANAMGAASVQKIGSGRNAPTCAEVQSVLKQSGVKIDLLC
jgi:sugar/nucleoside kinase (ribokinase family)